MALALITGHAAGIQIIAWVSMFVDRVQTETADQALANTFDGEHPCCLCHIAKALADTDSTALAGKAPSKTPEQIATKKPEMDRVSALLATLDMGPGFRESWPRSPDDSVQHRDPEPLTPPPRHFPS